MPRVRYALRESMTSNRIGRVFSPRAALASLGLLLAGLAVGAYCVYLVVDRRRLSLRGFLLSGALLLGAVAALTMAFPRGCSTCRAALEEAGAAFPIELSEPVERALFTGDAGAVYNLVRLPPPAPGAPRALLLAELCPRCARAGLASVRMQRWTGQDWHIDRQGATAELLDDRAHALATALRQRGPIV